MLRPGLDGLGESADRTRGGPARMGGAVGALDAESGRVGDGQPDAHRRGVGPRDGSHGRCVDDTVRRRPRNAIPGLNEPNTTSRRVTIV